MTQYLSPRESARSRSSSIDISTGSVIFVTVSFSATKESPASWEPIQCMLRGSFLDATFCDITPAVSHDESGSFWSQLESSGRHLPDRIQNKIGAATAPIVVLCHGLGGLISLQFIGASRILQQTAAFVLFGTPTNFSHNNFCRAIKHCARVEFGEKITKADLAECKQFIERFTTDQGVLNNNLHMIRVYESKRCSHTKHQKRFSRPPVVDENMVSFPSDVFPNSLKICSETEHCTMSDANSTTQVIDSIRDRLATYSPLHETVAQAETLPNIERSRSSASEFRKVSDSEASASDDVSPAEPSLLTPSTSGPSAPPLPSLTPDKSVRPEPPPLPPSISVNYEPLLAPSVHDVPALSQSTSVHRAPPPSRRPSRPRQEEHVHLIEFPSSPDFFGRRAKLEEIHERICPPTDIMRGPHYLALYGQPGMGKTQLARQFVKEVASVFKYILWVDASSVISIETGYNKYAMKLGLVSGVVDVSTSSKALRDWFDTCEEPYLVVLDSATNIKDILRQRPGGRMASVLVTTVDNGFVFGVGGMAGIPVDKLEDEEAIKMVLRGIPDDSKTGDDGANREEAKIFVQNFQGTALAVSVGIAVIKDDEMKLAAFNKRFSDDNRFICAVEDRYMTAEYNGCGGTYKSAIDQLLNQLNPKPRLLLNVMSLLHVSHIPESLFKSKNLPDDLKEQPFLRYYDKYSNKSINNLLKRGGSEDRVTFELHGVTSRIIRERMRPEEKRDAMYSATRLIIWAITQPDNNGDSPQARDRKLFEAYNMHIESLIKFYVETLNSGDAVNIPISGISLLGYSSWLCYSCGFLTNGLKHIKFAKTLIEVHDDKHRNRGPPSQNEDNEILDARMRLAHAHACIATELNKFGLALEKFTEELEIFQGAQKIGIPKLGGPGRLTKIYGGIANSHQGREDHREAIWYYRKCLNGPPEEQAFMSPYNVNICRSFIVLGDLKQAERRLTELIDDRTRRYGPDDNIDYISGHQKYILGNVRIHQDRIEEAFPLHKSALENWRITKGEKHHKTGDAWHKVGWHHVQRLEWAEAKAAFEKALLIYHFAKHGHDDDESFVHKGEIARTNYHLSGVLRTMGRAEEADKAMETSLYFRGVVLAERAKEKGLKVVPDQCSKAGKGAELKEEDFDDLVSLWVL